MDRLTVSLSLLSVGLLACASSESTAPHDLSAAEHDAQAAREELITNAHAAKYDPNAVRERPICSGVLARQSGYSGDVCWGSVTNPTDSHQVAAEQRRRVAAEHRAASQALRDAFVAVPGMTAQWLQRVVDCHVARNAALGHVDPSMPECPLVPRGVSTKVTTTAKGFAVAMRSDDRAVALDIQRRARLLIGGTP